MVGKVTGGRLFAGLMLAGACYASAAAQTPMAFASDLECDGRPARFGIAADVPTFEIGGRRYEMTRTGQQDGVTTYRSADGSITFLARGRSGVLVEAGDRRVNCMPAAAGGRMLQSPAGATDSLDGGWRVKSIAGAPVPDGVTVTMEFGADGRVAGRSGCNRYTGSFAHAGDTLKLSQLAGTRMACPPPQMDVEQRFFSAAGQVTGVRLSDNRELVLSGAAGPLLVLDRTH